MKNKKIKVLLVSPLPPPTGGIASWSLNLLNFYENNISNFEISHQNTAINYRSITNKNLFKRVISGFKNTLSIIREFKKELKIVNPDLIHLTSSSSLALFKDLILIYIAKKEKISIITHFHFGRIPELSENKNWEWYLLKKVINRSDYIIVIDEKSFVILKNNGFNNIINIPNPISIELEDIARKQKNTCVRNKKSSIVFVGHVIPYKGVYELVEACTFLNEVDQLLFVGPVEDKIKNELICLAKNRNNGEWLAFTGNIDKEGVLNYLVNAPILALPSYTEGFPYVVLEAMSMGCSVIGTKVGAIPEMLAIKSNKPCGLCVETKNVGQLIEAIKILICDTDTSKSMGNNGLCRVLENYTIGKIITLYEDMWIKVLNKKEYV